MSFKTMEVALDHGRVKPCRPETLPDRARALLTILDDSPEAVAPARTGGELLARWDSLPWLSPEEGEAFAADVEAARANLPPLSSKWD